MNRLYTTILAATALTFSAAAQQIPNSGFDDEWVDCIPWNSANTTTKQGTKPAPWCPSNVVTPGMSAGNQTIATEIAGNNSAKAIEVKNKAATSTQIIPAYFTLGTTWATAKVALMTPSDADGGTWGGLDFVFRPDAIQFDYKHTNGSGSTQPATVVVYSWIGSSSQENVPAANTWAFSKPADPNKITMINRDRNILNMDYAKGDVPTYSSDFKLISKKIEKISDTPSEWTPKTIEIDYESGATENPEKFNVVFSAADYFADRSNHKGDDALSIDNVKLLYYSRLKSLSVNGTAVADFDPNTYEYNIDAGMPTDASAIVAECLGNSGSGKAVVALDAANNKATITVTNVNADMVGRASSDVTDIDGQTSHVYTLNFKAGEEEKDPNTKNYIGELLVKSGEPLNLNEKTSDVNVEITPNADNTSCTFLLPNFSFSEMELGDIKVENVTITHENGLTKFNGKDDAMKLGPGGVIDASVTVTGTCDSEGNLAMVIDVVWHSGADAFGDYPIDVTFNGKGDAFGTSAIGGIESDVIDENAPVEYYNIQGMKVNGDNLAPGFYIVRQGKKVSKIFVK